MAHTFYLPNEGGFSEFQIEDGKVHRRLHSPLRNKIMKRNAELRRTPGAVRTTSFGKLELDIPVLDLHVLDKHWPGLADPGHPDHKWQLRAFMKSPASAPYRVQEHKKGVNR
ncbi:unnamed protein product [marine sediment metagenome]|uniref:Uncharacterized protein n=1 Tax=marine sediment metagenome TaxID=412755 RepID=X0T247_9ZZZZ